MIKINKLLLTGSIALLITINIYNLLNFVFRWTMVRMLDINDYRKLAVIISIIYLLAIFTESIQTIIARYVSIHQDKGKIKNLFKRTFKKATIVSLFVFLLYLLISIPLSSLVKIEYSILAVNGLLIFPLLFAPIVRGILQGRKQFFAFGSSLMVEGLIKVILSVSLVYLGLAVYGSLVAIIAAVSLSFIIALIPIRDILKSKETHADAINIYNYSLPVFIVNAVILIFLSLDVIITSIIFSEDLASQYAIASLVAQIMFIVTSPISKAMFPISSENSEKKISTKNIILNATLLLSVLLIIGLFLVYTLPDLLIFILSGKSSEFASEILFNLAIGFSILSLANLSLIYKISLGSPDKKRLITFISLIAILLFFILSIIILVKLSILQITLKGFSVAFIFTMAALLLSTLLLKKGNSPTQ